MNCLATPVVALISGADPANCRIYSVWSHPQRILQIVKASVETDTIHAPTGGTGGNAFPRDFAFQSWLDAA